MDLNSLPLLESFVKRMKWLTKNQEVVAHNIANADTPGFKAKALKDQDFQNLLGEVSNKPGPRRPHSLGQRASGGLAQTHQGHLSSAAADIRHRLYEPETFETSPDGNNVLVEEELMKVAKNQMDYGLMVNLYRKNVGFLKTALGRGGGR